MGLKNGRIPAVSKAHLLEFYGVRHQIHIFVSQKDFVTDSGTLPLSLSDHLPIFVSLNSRSNIFKQPGHKTLHIRSRKSLSIDAFTDDLSCAPWSTLEVFNDPSETIEQWYLLFNDVLDTHAPVKSRRVKRPRPPDWFSAEIGVTIKERNRLHKLASAHNNSSNLDAYRHARNKVVHMIRSAKRVFYRNAMKSNLDNLKNLWRIIRNISPAKCSNLPGHLSVNGNIVSDNTEIANQFNDHFANITSSVDLGDARLYPNSDYISEFVASKLPSSAPLFTIPPISEQDVESSLSRLKSNKAVGLDGVDGYFLKIAASAISNSLTTVFNLSISSGVFPDAWKVAKVTPLFKEGSLLDRSNFHPISVLAIVSKILERHVHSNLYDFLTCHDLLTDSQFGFRCFRSCELALVNLTDTLLANIDQGLLSGLLLIDLNKAFDLVDHTTLLSKLKLYGCSESSLKWFCSYLTNHSQKTTFKGSMSDPLPMSVGVPQGSIFGPLFFLIFINDLPFYLSSVSNVSLTMFADDTTILLTGSSVQLVERNLNQLAAEVSAWANINRMAINATKTKSMLVSSQQKLDTLLSQSLNVAVNDSKVEQVTEAKLLRVTFDHTLSWEGHVETLCKNSTAVSPCYAEFNHILPRWGPYTIIMPAFIASLFTALMSGVPALKHFSSASFVLKNVLPE